MALESSSDIGTIGLDGWLYRSGEHVCGPVTEQEIVRKMYAGEFTAATEVSTGDGIWRRISETKPFSGHIEKAVEAIAERTLKVEKERLERRTRNIQLVTTGAIVLASVAVIVTIGLAAHKYRVWEIVTGVPPERVDVVGATMEEWVDRHPPLVSLGLSKQLKDNEEAARKKERERALAALDRSVQKKTKAQKEAPKAEEPDGMKTATAALDDSVIFSTIKKNFSSIVACIRGELQRTPELRGQIDLEFVINNDGTIGAVSIEDPRFREGSMIDCFRGKLSAWRFPAFEGERKIVKYPFTVGKKQ